MVRVNFNKNENANCERLVSVSVYVEIYRMVRIGLSTEDLDVRIQSDLVCPSVRIHRKPNVNKHPVVETYWSTVLRFVLPPEGLSCYCMVNH